MTIHGVPKLGVLLVPPTAAGLTHLLPGTGPNRPGNRFFEIYLGFRLYNIPVFIVFILEFYVFFVITLGFRLYKLSNIYSSVYKLFIR
mmetsp:Transcript_3566/g.539  ORF Transcript_3566/g.539 Transcript_3566/m.539 type:complete len:88 (-) Transcript_3566:143-406(-)